MTPRNLAERFDKAVQMLTDRFRELEDSEVELRFALFDKEHNGELLGRDEILRALDVKPAQYRIVDLAVANREGAENVIFVRPSGFLTDDAWQPVDKNGIEPFKILSE